ncbi:Acyl-CoA synthetase (AMP-forming)/AMP-acid ligase II [Variovorax sp. CF079]|uniref:class I adenylate-forming enzyme family protein n=1 Tax=Variovorax sp. CF079 TaxID=1882774 RepID=UPI000886D0D6|nr:class I adenylate-forming enzyme family protein [Variovorax sp. CF079]SDE80067.1 Acyl-CoA synthetase (AMP-forming)/AMP-acid ligase II [Variovorax sp. CF079]
MSSATTSWGKEIATEMVGGIPYRMYTDRPRRVEQLLAFAGRWDARPHLVQGERVLSFEDLHRGAVAKARELADLGIRRGDRIFILGWNGPEWVVNFWACFFAGAVPVLANAWWSSLEVANGLAALQPAMTLADERCAPRVPAGARRGPWDIPHARGAGGQVVPDAQAPGDEEETALIIFTSGTSGQPKAVVLSHRALLARLQMTLHITRKLPHQIDETARDVTLITGPLFHVGGMQTLMRAVVVGDTLVLSEGRYDPAEVLAAIERNQVKRWNAVPTMVTRLLDHPDVPRRDLSSLKSISIGGAPVHAELMQRIRTQLPSVSPRIPTGYGLTENGGQATAAAGSEALDELGSAGKPLPCVEIRFLPHPGLPDGEILLRSPTQMSGFFGLDESPIDEEGWLRTGDLGRLDDKGNLWITGRCKDMIIRGGENIAPAAIERALLNIPGVTETVVFGVPHRDLGEEVMAVVVTDADFTPQQLQDQLRGQIASFAVPSQWRLQREPLPTNHTGKVDKAAISAQVRAELQNES